MKLGEFRKLTARCGDDWTLDFGDPNFGGRLEYCVNGDDTLDSARVTIVQEQKQVLLDIPCIEPYND
jgi:hypothetical protein